MAPRRTPDILRKSHAHSAGKARARDKQALRQDLDDSIGDAAAGTALLIDLDGVVYRGDEAIPGAAEALAELDAKGIRRLFVTNTTSRPRADIVAKLAGFGIAASVDEILTPTDAAADWLAERGLQRVLPLVPPATAAAFERFQRVTPAAADRGAAVDAIVVGDLGRAWTFDALNAAFRCLMREPAPALVALGMTRYWRAPDGLRLDTAPFVAALEHASGVAPVVLGKPATAFFGAALARLGASAAGTVMIGDDIRADVAGAQAAGLRAMLVRTGKFRPGDLEQGIVPDRVIDSVAALPRALSEEASTRGGAPVP